SSGLVIEPQSPFAIGNDPARCCPRFLFKHFHHRDRIVINPMNHAPGLVRVFHPQLVAHPRSVYESAGRKKRFLSVTMLSYMPGILWTGRSSTVPRLLKIGQPLAIFVASPRFFALISR